MKKIFLLGKHSNRTPFSYEGYKRYFLKHFEYTENAAVADFIIVGFVQDITDNIAEIAAIRQENKNVKIVVLSEEPLWDTLWGTDWAKKNHSIKLKNETVDYVYLNAKTTSIFDFDEFPYFITTDDDFFLRYTDMFEKNAQISREELSIIWKGANYKQSYIAEKRQEEETWASIKDNSEVFGLSILRTQIAEAMAGPNNLVAGKGWGGSNKKRQALVDWHLDKLVQLNRKVFIVSAIENTHIDNYVTEKIFDAFAVLGIPIYCAGPNHYIHNVIPKNAYINIYGLSFEEVLNKINKFEPDEKFIDAYILTQKKLANMFKSPKVYFKERSRFVLEIVNEIENFST